MNNECLASLSPKFNSKAIARQNLFTLQSTNMLILIKICNLFDEKEHYVEKPLCTSKL